MFNFNFLNLQNIQFKYPGTQRMILDGISLNIEKGSSLIILGPNGSGKSTLLKILAGLLFPLSGTYEALGSSITKTTLKERPFGIYFRKEIGYLFQNSEVQLFNGSVEDELAFGPRQLLFPENLITERVQKMIYEFGLDHLASRPPFQLSGGEKKKVALASILTINPSILILDEPTAGLDTRSTYLFVDRIKKLNEEGKTLIIACHDLHLISDLATRLIVFNEASQIVADGNPESILQDKGLFESFGNL